MGKGRCQVKGGGEGRDGRQKFISSHRHERGRVVGKRRGAVGGRGLTTSGSGKKKGPQSVETKGAFRLGRGRGGLVEGQRRKRESNQKNNERGEEKVEFWIPAQTPPQRKDKTAQSRI